MEEIVYNLNKLMGTDKEPTVNDIRAYKWFIKNGYEVDYLCDIIEFMLDDKFWSVILKRKGKTLKWFKTKNIAGDMKIETVEPQFKSKRKSNGFVRYKSIEKTKKEAEGLFKNNLKRRNK
jgi:hypothetical protein